MDGEIISSRTDSRVEVPSEGKVEIYRVPEQQHEVVARIVNDKTEEIGLGIRDGYVSRRGTDTNPKYVKLFKRDDQIFIIDNGQAKDTRIEDFFNPDPITLSKGKEYSIFKDSKLYLGDHTRLNVNVIKEEGQTSVDPIKIKIGVRINQCKKWLNSGSNQEALREAKALSELLQQEELLDDDNIITTEAYQDFLDFEENLENQLDDIAGEYRSEESVNEKLKNQGIRILNRLDAIYR